MSRKPDRDKAQPDEQPRERKIPLTGRRTWPTSQQQEDTEKTDQIEREKEDTKRR
jgi:hypothetical protein